MDVMGEHPVLSSLYRARLRVHIALRELKWLGFCGVMRCAKSLP